LAPPLSGARLKAALPSLAGAVEWLNSPPLTPEGLKGKVVLIDFWTYTCINWLRTAPYVRGWAEKYREQGLVVIGVHAPEFGFEKNLDNVRRAAKELRVDYPIAVDNEHAIWRATRRRNRRARLTSVMAPPLRKNLCRGSAKPRGHQQCAFGKEAHRASSLPRYRHPYDRH
jgi:thiol-disulfide isomerase/thioredoxin